MQYFYVHPDDARWLRRWLRNNVLCVAAILGFLALIRWDAYPPLEVMQRAGAVHVVESGQPRAVAPQGWRRTNRGWEHVSTWRRPSRDLAEIIRLQETREPAWIRSILAGLRGIPPLVYAFIQVGAIAAIVHVTRRGEQTSMARTV